MSWEAFCLVYFHDLRVLPLPTIFFSNFWDGLGLIGKGTGRFNWIYTINMLGWFIAAVSVVFYGSMCGAVRRLISGPKAAGLLILSFLFIYSTFVFSNLSIHKRDRGLGMKSTHYSRKVLNHGGLLLWQIAESSGFNEKNLYSALLEYNAMAPALTLKASTKSKKPKNILVIQVESLETALLQSRFSESMPNLRRLMQDFAYSPRLLSHHFAGGSSDAEFFTLNGLIPSLEFASFRMRKINYEHSIPRLLKDNNYVSEAFHPNERGFYNRDAAYKKMGFRQFWDPELMQLPTYKWGSPDHMMFEFMRNRIGQLSSGDPFFLYAITLSTHQPFDLIDGYASRTGFEDVKDASLRDYFRSFKYLDQALGDFLEFAQKLPNTLIVIFGDHAYFSEIPDDKYAGSLRELDDIGKIEFVPLFIYDTDLGVSSKKILGSEIYIYGDVYSLILESAGISATVKTWGVPMLKKLSAADKKHLYKDVLLPYRDVKKSRKDWKTIYETYFHQPFKEPL
jgi:phosphoglycerol transferase MdoB-like AlkP superfamily enzyme